MITAFPARAGLTTERVPERWVLYPIGDDLPHVTWRKLSQIDWVWPVQHQYPTRGCHGVLLTKMCPDCAGHGTPQWLRVQ